MLALAAGLTLLPGTAQGADPEPSVSIVTLPRGESLAAISWQSPELTMGLLSPGLGIVSGAQTYLDISQGNRLNGSLYPYPLPGLPVSARGVPRKSWQRTLRRAEDAPAQLVPGLLADTLAAGGVEAGAAPGVRTPALIAVLGDGSIERRADCELGDCPGLTVAELRSEKLGEVVDRLEGDDLLIAFEQAPGDRRLLPFAVAGAGFTGGQVGSPTTRLDGYVLATDIAPTILDRFGLEIPDEMSGQPITDAGERPVEELVTLQNRLIEISDRRHPVLGVNLIIWVAVVLAGIPFLGRRWVARALPVLATTITWVPTLLLATAALSPSFLGERLIIGIGAPLLAFGTLFALRRPFGVRAPYAAFALAAVATVASSAIDILAGSPLTALSVIGSNPALGVRFFGIGNEMEAVIGVLLPLGSGAAVAALRPRDPMRAVAFTVSVATLVAILIFAPGRFGADVGAAITFPAGAAGVIFAALGGGRRRLALLIAAPALALLALIGIDLLIGGDAHLSRSVLSAGGLDELGDVIERRTRLGAASFERFFDSFFFMVALGAILVSVLKARTILDWFEGTPAARAGLLGGAAAAVVGTLANDSGALILMIATAYMLGYAAIGWSAQYFTSDSDSR